MPRYYILNKPRAHLTACRDERCKTVMDLFPHEEREGLFPIGRLDKDTEGLLIVTDDGSLFAHLMRPENKVTKTYFFYALGNIDKETLCEIEGGIKLYPTRDVVSAPAKVEMLGECRLSEIKDKLSPDDLKRANRRPDTPVIYGTVTVCEGKKHQVKRMILYGGARIVYLKRISIGTLSLDKNLLTGEYRPLTSEEIEILKR